jgi:hypothetical protein
MIATLDPIAPVNRPTPNERAFTEGYNAVASRQGELTTDALQALDRALHLRQIQAAKGSPLWSKLVGGRTAVDRLLNSRRG